MANPNSITIKKELITQLQPIICCSETLSTCRDDEFCSSDPSTWPTKVNGHETVRLAYPVEEDSMEGAKEFCNNYLRWYTRSSCGTSDTRTKDAFDKSDLENVAMFCEDVKEYASTETNWRDLLTGAGGVGTLGAIVIIGKKILNFFKKGAEKLKETSETIDSVGKGVESVSASAKHFFGISLPALGKALKYVFTLEWCRKKKPEAQPAPDTKAPPSKDGTLSDPTKTAPTKTTTASEDAIKANPEVVEAQLAEFVKLDDTKFEGKLFLTLSPTAKKYLADLAIRRWAGESDVKKKLFTESDQALSDGKLPHDYLLKFARYHLRSTASIEVVEASARIATSAADSTATPRKTPPAPAEFDPKPVEIRRQLIQFAHFNDATPATQNYIAKLAMSDWSLTPPEIQANFTSEGDRPETGELPQKFIRFFRKSRLEKMHYIAARAALYEQLTEAMPHLLNIPFNVIDSRLGTVARGWSHLPKTVKEEFGKLSGVDSTSDTRVIPLSFSDYMLKVISFSQTARPTAKAMKIDWRPDESQPVIHHSIDIRPLMEFIALQNSQLKHYPEVLRARAALTLDAWQILHEEIKNEFVAVDDEARKAGAYKGPEQDSIPSVFVKYILKVNEGIGTNPRKGGDDPRGDGGSTNGGGTPTGGGGSGGTFIFSADEFARTQEMVRPRFESMRRGNTMHTAMFRPFGNAQQFQLAKPMQALTQTGPMLMQFGQTAMTAVNNIMFHQMPAPILK